MVLLSWQQKGIFQESPALTPAPSWRRGTVKPLKDITFGEFRKPPSKCSLAGLRAGQTSFLSAKISETGIPEYLPSGLTSRWSF